MQKQCTIRDNFELVGIEPFGGQKVMVKFSPSKEDSGIVFYTASGSVRAEIASASQYMCSLLLCNGAAAVIHPEHLLATLYAYGIDNAQVELERMPSRHFRTMQKLGLATSIEALPNFDGKTLELCRRLDYNIREQNVNRKILRCGHQLGELEKDKLIAIPINYPGLTIQATTDYRLFGEQTVSIEVDPKTYKKEIAESRPYVKHFSFCPSWMLRLGASLANPSFGLGHGFEEDNVLLPDNGRNGSNQIYRNYASGDEVTRHTIMDRLGALALLPGRLEGMRIVTKFSGHRNDIKRLAEMLPQMISV